MSNNNYKKKNWILLLIGAISISLVNIKSFRIYPLDFNRATNSVIERVQNYDWNSTEFYKKTIGDEGRNNTEEKGLFASKVEAETFVGEPDFYSKIIHPIPQEIREKMIGVTWRAQCPIKLEQLALLEVRHWNVEGQVVQGKLIVNRDVAEPLSRVFMEIFQLKFPIERMRPAYEFNGDDIASMEVNNTSAFNCRPVEDTRKWSQHAYGKAVDINPLFNPYIKKSVILPPSAYQYVARKCNDPKNYPGMICAGSQVVKAFEKIGWKWGGYWTTLKDYQHFSHNGL